MGVIGLHYIQTSDIITLYGLKWIGMDWGVIAAWLPCYDLNCVHIRMACGWRLGGGGVYIRSTDKLALQISLALAEMIESSRWLLHHISTNVLYSVGCFV
jgi:hypothetical protein